MILIPENLYCWESSENLKLSPHIFVSLISVCKQNLFLVHSHNIFITSKSSFTILTLFTHVINRNLISNKHQQTAFQQSFLANRLSIFTFFLKKLKSKRDILQLVPRRCSFKMHSKCILQAGKCTYFWSEYTSIYVRMKCLVWQMCNKYLELGWTPRPDLRLVYRRWRNPIKMMENCWKMSSN